jgi:hypothetical protein
MANREVVVAWVRRPASAAIAGIVFAVILATVIVLVRSAAPVLPAHPGTWTDAERSSAISTALTLMPFAGIAFLWFVGVVRAQVAPLTDRFFETVFLGSGLIFVVMLFASAASLSAVLRLQDAGLDVPLETRAFAWSLATGLLGSFGARMAAVFTISVSSVVLRAGRLPRWLPLSGYVAGLLLLLTPPLDNATALLFPLWVLALSITVLVRRDSGEVA